MRSGYAKNWFESGASLNRRDFVRGGAALAGAAGLMPVAAHAQQSNVRVFTGGKILTVDRYFSEAQAIAIRGNKIIAVGSDSDVRKAAGESAEIIDLKGRIILPGFVEPHTHMLSGALLASVMEYVGVAKFSKTEEVLDYLRSLADKKKPGEWIVARNFDPSLQEGPDALTFKELDGVSTKHPVFVLNSSGHLGYANRAAFKVAGIDESVKNPEGAEFVRDEAGRLTGVMKNNVAFLKVVQHYPALAKVDP